MTVPQCLLRVSFHRWLRAAGSFDRRRVLCQSGWLSVATSASLLALSNTRGATGDSFHSQ